MKLFELFDKTDDLGHVAALSQEFHAFKDIGGRRMRFSAGLTGDTWEVEFAEVSGDEVSDDENVSQHGMTGKGHEIEVMSFVMSCFRHFIEKYKPMHLEFEAKSSEQSRVSLYRRMLKRFAKDYFVREFDVGMGRAEKYKTFDLTRKSITEGQIKDETGYIKWNWKSDLADEEGPEYLPSGYSQKVLELSIIETKEQGKGHGEQLMKKFLASADAKKAELIFLDPNPHEGANWGTSNEEETIARLQKFYRRFGFRNRPGHARMWLVQKGQIPDNRLPT